MATTHVDRLFTEIDRQLTEVRATADGIATRAGLLISATALGAGLLGSRLATLHSGLAELALVLLAAATVAGGAVLVPALKLGPTPTTLQSWLGEEAKPTIRTLYAAKTLALEANMQRLVVMRLLLYGQGVAVIAAIALVVVAASGK